MILKHTVHNVFKRFTLLDSRQISSTCYSAKRLISAKEKKNLSFVEIANHIGRSETWTAGLFYGQCQANQAEVQKLTELLNLSNQDLRTTTEQDQDTSSRKLKLFPVIDEILSFPILENEIITARGWIKTIRRQKKVSFIELVDGSSSGHLQVVLQPKDSEGLETGCAIQVSGTLVKSLGHQQPNELKANHVLLIGACPSADYPLQKKSSHGSAFLRKIPHLRLRTQEMAALLRIRSLMAREASLFLDHHHFFRTETPIITFNDCEGAGQVFSIRPDKQINSTSKLQVDQSSQINSMNQVDHRDEFFGREAFLTVSGQLHLEALAASLGRVYTIGPAFRAERSQTNRHLAEFWMLEAELSFIQGLGNLMDLVEDLIKSIIKNLHRPDSSSAHDLHLLGSPQQPLTCIESNWQRITYDYAIELIQSQRKTSPSGGPDDQLPLIGWGQPLASEHERWLAEAYAQGPIFVTDYPSSLKPFYMRQNQASKIDKDSFHQSLNQTMSTATTVSCFDLLVPGIGELVGGSLRESDLMKLEQSMISDGILDQQSTHRQPIFSALSEETQEMAFHNRRDPKFDWYLDLRRFGSHSNAGFGIGWERLLSWLSGIPNVRECIAFPRVSGSGFC